MSGETTALTGADPAGHTSKDWIDPLHTESSAEIHWTRANAEEIFPAAITPFTWSFVGEPGERGWRASFIDAGIFSEAERARPDNPDRRAWSIFFGRPAFNYEHLKYFAFAAFSSTDETARSLRARARAWQSGKRWLKTVYSTAVLPRKLTRLRMRSEKWWHRWVELQPIDDMKTAARGLEEARELYEDASRLHVLNSAVPVAWAYARIAEMAAQAGIAERASTVSSGFASLEEVQLAQSIWEVAQGQRPFAEFIATYGYRGPVESEVSSRSWREDPAPVRELMQSMQSSDPASAPTRAQERRRVERVQLERQLILACPPLRRPWRVVVLAIARKYVPLRQVGKVALVQSIDIARLCARTIGCRLREQGRLAHESDVFFLTAQETIDAARGTTESLQSMIEWRKTRHAEYSKLEIPRDFYGTPRPAAQVGASQIAGRSRGSLRGQGVSAGTVEGRARVLANAGENLHPGEILVSHFTDPGWTPLLVIAAGVVLDVGGSMSHGAIIARELGVPCVLGTNTATSDIRTGDRLRVDGGKGIVEILERAP
jgi:phosphohistidine swiveling domain-containing protein